MTKTLKFYTGARRYLEANGFSPTTTKKVAGLQEFWAHQDGRKARVGYGLMSKTAQHSLGAGATWGYLVWLD